MSSEVPSHAKIGYVPYDQDHPQEKKRKKVKWLSEEALQIADK